MRIRRPPPLVVLLTVVAGFLDAFSLTGPTRTFIANQTGNTVLIGIGIANGDAVQIWSPLVAAAAFVAGAAATPIVVRNARPEIRHARLLAVEIALVAAYVVAVLAAVGTEAVLAGERWLFVLITLSSSAMGVQSAIITRTRGAAVSTTFTSGMLAEVGHLVGMLVAVGPDRRREPAMEASVVAFGIAAYIAGAALGALAAEHGTLWTLGPLAVLVVLFVGERHRSRSARSAPRRG